MVAGWLERRVPVLAAFLLGMIGLLCVQWLIHRAVICPQKYDLLTAQSQCADHDVSGGAEAYEQLRQSLISHVTAWEKAHGNAKMSVYFRKLNNGPRIGVQEDEYYNAASLLKLPIMIGILSRAEVQPLLLDEELTFTGDMQEIMNVNSEDETIQPNTPYTVRELLRRMIVFSDNRSKELLVWKLNETPPSIKSNVFLDLGMMEMMSGKVDTLSMQSYGNLFAILYNTAYLSPELSQLALQFLTEATFKDGIVAGVPEHVRVAHKFGFYAPNPALTELHDCGIVYHPAGPYVLCVMTKGTDRVSEAAGIADISKAVYDGVTDITKKY